MLHFLFPQVMRKRRVAAARQRTLAVNLREKVKTRSKVEMRRRRMRTEGKGGGRPAVAGVKAAKRGPGKCGTRKRSSAATTTATTTSPKPGAAERRAVKARMKETTEEAVGVAAPLQHTATTAATTQRRVLRVEVEVRGLRTPATPVTVNKLCRLESVVMTTVLPTYSAP